MDPTALVDYIISHVNNFGNFQNLLISEPNEFSDHCIVSSTLLCDYENNILNEEDTNDTILTSLNMKWTQLNILKYKESLITGDCLKSINDCINYQNTDPGTKINTLVDKLNIRGLYYCLLTHGTFLTELRTR